MHRSPRTADLQHGEPRFAQDQVLGERTRIAREIHDVLAHSLGALAVQIETTRALLADRGDIATAIKLLEYAGHLADDGLTETREAVHALRVASPALPEGLANLAAKHQQLYTLPVEITISGRTRVIGPDTNLALIRVAREALTNAARHAPGAAVVMHLEYTRRFVTLSIVNPVQPDLVSQAGGQSRVGYGLAGMSERLQLAGGTLRAGLIGGRWMVRAQVPL